MKFKLVETILKEATPYMLARDGELIECGVMHPYLKYIIQNSNEREICSLFNDRIDHIKWFLKYCKNESILADLQLFIDCVYNTSFYNVDKELMDKELHINKHEDTGNRFDIEALFELLNRELNQLWLKIRTSHMRLRGNSRDIYIRVGSSGFNWFDTIWKFIYDNRNWITSVTITNDPQASEKPVSFYKHGDLIINQIPTEEFITLSGNPLIEKLYARLDCNKSLNEIFFEVHPQHINYQMKMLEEMYYEDNFVEVKDDEYTL